MSIRIPPHVALTIALLLSAILGVFSISAADAGQSQFYEVRIYSTKSEGQQKQINEYWQSAAVPAYNRLGIQPIGVFTELQASPTNRIFVLIPCDSLEIFQEIPSKLASDSEYQKAAAGYLSAVKTNANYERFESSLLVAFDGMKHLVVPSSEKKPGLFELRTYLSPSEGKGLNKVEMFNRGEIQLMKDVGLGPVFYGRTLIGAQMPCLTYMLSAENMEAHKKHWQGFSASPIWKKMSSDPQYQDNVSGIISVMLKSTSASQL